MTKKSPLILFSFLLTWATITILALTWGTQVNWPDNVHTNYGFPLTWSTHTTSTLIGSVNLWMVDMSALIINFTFWIVIMLIAVSILLVLFNKKASNFQKRKFNQ